MDIQTSSQEENFQHLFDFAPDSIVVIDQSSKIVLWNPKSEQLFGWTAAEVIGVPLSTTIIPQEYRSMHEAGMNRFLTTGEIHVLNTTIDITALKKDGNVFPISLTISKAMMAGHLRFIAFIRDISREKELQRHVHLQQQQLEKRNDELAQYASMASHDLKEPIRKILLFSDLLQHKHSAGTSAEQQALLQKISETAEKMKVLMDGISVFSSITVDLEQSHCVNLAEVMEEVQQDFWDSVQKKKAVVQTQVTGIVRVRHSHVYPAVRKSIK